MPEFIVQGITLRDNRVITDVQGYTYVSVVEYKRDAVISDSEVGTDISNSNYSPLHVTQRFKLDDAFDLCFVNGNDVDGIIVRGNVMDLYVPRGVATASGDVFVKYERQAVPIEVIRYQHRDIVPPTNKTIGFIDPVVLAKRFRHILTRDIENICNLRGHIVTSYPFVRSKDPNNCLSVSIDGYGYADVGCPEHWRNFVHIAASSVTKNFTKAANYVQTGRPVPFSSGYHFVSPNPFDGEISGFDRTYVAKEIKTGRDSWQVGNFESRSKSPRLLALENSLRESGISINDLARAVSFSRSKVSLPVGIVVRRGTEIKRRIF